MRYGIALPNYGPLASAATLVHLARRAEERGVDSVWVSDHLVAPTGVRSIYPYDRRPDARPGDMGVIEHFYEPLTTLAYLAGATRRIRLGVSAYVVPYRPALVTAKQIASLDALSGGRVILGAGVGWLQEEFEALGVPFNRRGAISDETLAIVRRCWTEDVVTHAGRFFTFRDVHTAPRPLRRPPIWIGGGSDAALRRAVRHGDAWHPIRIKLGPLREALVRLQRIAGGESRPVPALCPRMRLCLTASPMPENDRMAGHGTLDQVRRDLEALAALGARYVLLDTYMDDPEATRDHEAAWAMLATLAARALDLTRQTVR